MARAWRKVAGVTGLVGAMAIGLGGGALASEPPAEESTAFLGGFLRESRVVYPTELRGWKAQNEHRYEDQATGVSVRYMPTDESRKWLDVYFYPAGVLNAEEPRRVVRSELDSIDRSRSEDGGETHVDGLSAYSLPEGGLPAYSASLRFEASGTTYHSAYLLLLDRLYYVKGRLSAEADVMSASQAEASLKRLMSEVASRTLITSSGGCWTVDQLPSDMLSRTAVDDSGHRHLVGCDSAEPWNPEVDEGMREIRFEYRPQPIVRESLKKEA
ncbi:hypothetical protein [Marilutibacter maris]|uniref:hypothetical protein n=1 Tax=Marilutibacter maris TaxID=1605891 RepID=UPI0011AE7050|nr:hypothetical protein [Lysobacter maris]